MPLETLLIRPADQFRLMALACVSDILAALPDDMLDAFCESYPLLSDYHHEAQSVFGDCKTPWRSIIEHCQKAQPDWPIQRLAGLGLEDLHVRLLISLAMVEEDNVLSILFEPEIGPPTLGGLTARWRNAEESDAPELVRSALQDLVECGLVTITNSAVPRNERSFVIIDSVADLLLGLVPRKEGAQFVSSAALQSANGWIAPLDDCATPGQLAEQLAAGDFGVMLLRGAARNGRMSFAQMALNTVGLNLLQTGQDSLSSADAMRVTCALAILGKAALLADAEVAPGEMLKLALPHFAENLPIIITCSERASIDVQGPVKLRSISLPMPTPEARIRHWQACGLKLKAATQLGHNWLLTSGNIRRAASNAPAGDSASIRRALRDLRDARIDALASPVDQVKPPVRLFLDREGGAEIETLILRCRHREKLSEAQGTAGVKALLSGASGTGKTLAARQVAWQLGKDLYRIDLSATVNKYIGETEKALERALSAAEELDIVLLLDEGDALMTRRTDVGTSNDRYANLETNFLLQRIESFAGILLVTTNDAERIDQAFSRRMDAAIILRPPDQVQREEILQSHIGRDAAVSAALIRDIACRCTLTGGQIRNIVLHARLLAINGQQKIGDIDLRMAVEREYRKIGVPCPLRSDHPASAGLALVG